MKRIKWQGWGYEGEEFPPDRKKKIVEILSGILGISEDKDYSPAVSLDDVKISHPQIDVDRLRQELKDSEVSIAKYDRVVSAGGKSYKNLLRARYGKIENPPDAVVFISSVDDIKRVFEFCQKNDIVCVPRGGGTSVVGGVDTYDISKPKIVLDMTRFNSVLDVDVKSRIAKVQAGIRGPDLEDQLRTYGVSVRHYPQSYYFSTLGGWIASRSAGHFSSRYGKIEDMILALEVVTPAGVVKNLAFPSTACGPNIPQLFAGSEGIFGVITTAEIKLHPIPSKKFSSAFVFPDFESASETARRIIQLGINPPLMRILDEREQMVSAVLSSSPLKPGALFLIGFEAEDENEQIIRSEFEFVKKICVKCGGVEEEKRTFEDWKKEYFAQPYLRDVLMDYSIVVDTLETATSWSNLMNLYSNVKSAMENAIFSKSVGGVGCRITHIYESGASLYFTYFAKSKKGEEEDFWWSIKSSASDAIVSHGGTISHHHGVGRDHKKWAKSELKDVIPLLYKVKMSLDPKNIMNPGVIFDPA